MLDDLRGVGAVCDRLQPEADARLQLSGRALERRQGLVVAAGLAGRITDAPMDSLRCARKLGADFADAVAEADDIVEATPCELAEMLRTAPRQVDPARAHHPHGIGMQRLGIA